MNFLSRLQDKLSDLTSPLPTFNVEQEIEYPIYCINVNNLIDPRAVIDNVLAYKKINPQTHETNVFAWRSDYFTHLKTNLFDPIKTIFEQIGNSYLSSVYKGPTNLNVQVVNLWAMVYNELDYARWHNHGNAFLSMVYYAEIDKDSAPLEFHNEGTKPISILPTVGDIMFFAGPINHRVPKLEVSSQRTVVAANLFCKKNEV